MERRTEHRKRRTFLPHRTMMILRTFSVSLISAMALLSPMAAQAALSPVDYGDGGIMQTPLSAKGRFVFVQRMSRRLLVQYVERHQKPVRWPIVHKELL